MQNKDYESIEVQIGYKFNNRLLLQQAFTRKSYTDETHDVENNEVLEFIGDKVLDIIVVKELVEGYGRVNDEREFACKIAEGDLTKLKKKFVQGSMLAHRIDELCFSQYLIMGKGDIKNNVQEKQSVKEDLFEAILGAITIDCDWNFKELQNVVELMLNLDYIWNNEFGDCEDYVALVQQWCQKNNGVLPRYEFLDKSCFDYDMMLTGWIVNCNERNIVINKQSKGNFACKLFIDDGKPFVGFGCSKNLARISAAEVAYKYLIKEGLFFTIFDEIGEPKLDTAVGQLQELAQKGYCEMPKYIFMEYHNESGNPLWYCDCVVKDCNITYSSSASTKKEAKRKAAYSMLKTIIELIDNENYISDEFNDYYEDPMWCGYDTEDL